MFAYTSAAVICPMLIRNGISDEDMNALKVQALSPGGGGGLRTQTSVGYVPLSVKKSAFDVS